MISANEIAQYALMVNRQIEKLQPFERGEVLAVAGALIQIEINRELRRQANPAGFVEDE